MSWDKMTPVHPHELIPRAEKKARNQQSREWEKKNPPTCFSIPAPLAQTAHAVREKILSCAEFDEAGRPRLDPITADVSACVLLSWAIAQVANTPSLIPVSNTPHSKTGLTAYAAEWNTWHTPPPFPKPTRKRKKGKSPQPKLNLSYRIPTFMKEEVHAITKRTGLPLGEVFLRLLQIGLDDYKAMKFRFAIEPEVVYRSATWQRLSDG